MKCQNCKVHKGTETWLGEGSVLDYAHGNYQMWCKCCVLLAQIKHAKKIANNLPKLVNKLLKTKCN